MVDVGVAGVELGCEMGVEGGEAMGVEGGEGEDMGVDESEGKAAVLYGSGD